LSPCSLALALKDGRDAWLAAQGQRPIIKINEVNAQRAGEQSSYRAFSRASCANQHNGREIPIVEGGV
tara:strand:- start:72 stop:275 length:204 start_codon:yes stop_codon:yes gene_type:complete